MKYLTESYDKNTHNVAYYLTDGYGFKLNYVFCVSVLGIKNTYTNNGFNYRFSVDKLKDLYFSAESSLKELGPKI
ncbi:MAG: hypothetical protein EOM87_06125 [Clostridia bacterium]|nr:hypothetical protein [Clostridia bacterium]